ncbi:MAG: hypothetical protein M3125_09935 [Gemmatimonadota bacterium]|nr:hypothetical protein [Gemmatimonadota bacterium]
MRRLTAAALAVLTLGIVSACGDDDDVDIREAERSPSSAMLADEEVVKQMRSNDSGNRIIYAPAPDLSLSAAQQRRPDIFRAPGAPATPTRPAPRDTTTTGTTARTRNP